MPEHIFNSRDTAYKSKYGAIAVGESVTFRLLLPQSYAGLDITAASLVLMADGAQNLQKLPLVKTSEQYVGSDYWAINVVPEYPGLYWYHFEFVAGGYTHHLYRGKYSTGYVDSAEESWQLTVYSGEQTIAAQWKGGIMYQIFPDRFKSANNEKQIPEGRKHVAWRSTPEYVEDPATGLWNNDYFGGDLKGIEEELPYLASLGVTILYLNPIFEAHSNHRYDTANYLKVDPLLGTEEDFIDLCVSAHHLGIKIILDGVFSHTGIDSVYFNRMGRYDSVGAYQSKDSPYFSWYQFNNWPNDYKSWWGISLLPEVDEKNPSYMNFIAGKGGVIEKWLKLGADGWRLDVADELPDEFIVAIRHRIKETNPDALLIGEVWEDASNKTAYFVRRQYLLGRELDSVMNYPFREAIIDFVADDNAEDFFEKILTITENYPKEILDTLMNPLGTHDTVRILTRLAGISCEGMSREQQAKIKLNIVDKDKALKLLRLAAVLQYTLPGFPSIYYGDEIGMEGGKDPFNRFAYPWYERDMELLNFYQRLGTMRKRNAHILADADFVPISAADGVVCFERSKKSEWGDAISLIVLINRGDDTVNYTLPERVVDTNTLLASDNVLVETPIVQLPPMSFAVLENCTIIKKTHLAGSRI